MNWRRKLRDANPPVQRIDGFSDAVPCDFCAKPARWRFRLKGSRRAQWHWAYACLDHADNAARAAGQAPTVEVVTERLVEEFDGEAF